MFRLSVGLAPLLLAACLPAAPSASSMTSPGLGESCSASPAGTMGKDPSAMDYGTATGDSTIGAVPRLWSKQYAREGEVCKGTVHKFDASLAVEVESNDSLGTEAVEASMKGKLCTAKVYRAAAADQIKVYRVWSSDAPATQYGSWWSLEMPAGRKVDFLASHGSCASWGNFDRLTECTVRAGVEFAIGPGQSVSCDNRVSYDKSEVNQVFIPVRPPNPASMWLENCRVVAENPLTE
jgi:hypothetical protein